MPVQVTGTCALLSEAIFYSGAKPFRETAEVGEGDQGTSSPPPPCNAYRLHLSPAHGRHD